MCLGMLGKSDTFSAPGHGGPGFSVATEVGELLSPGKCDPRRRSPTAFPQRAPGAPPSLEAHLPFSTAALHSTGGEGHRPALVDYEGSALQAKLEPSVR